MPKQSLITRVHPNTKQIYDAINLAVRIQNLRQSDIAKAINRKQNTVSYHLIHHSFDQDQLNDVLDFLGLEIKVCAKQS